MTKTLFSCSSQYPLFVDGCETQYSFDAVQQDCEVFFKFTAHVPGNGHYVTEVALEDFPLFVLGLSLQIPELALEALSWVGECKQIREDEALYGRLAALGRNIADGLE